MITKIIKRDGTEVAFDAEKIFNAISNANAEVSAEEQLNNVGLQITTQMIVEQLNKFKRAVEVEEIQEIVETELMKMKAYEVAKRYIRYRYDHKLKRESDTDKKGNVSCGVSERSCQAGEQQQKSGNHSYTEGLYCRRDFQGYYYAAPAS